MPGEVESTIATVASKVTYGGSAASVLSGWWFSSEAGVAFGLLLGLAGFTINWFFKRQQNQRLHAEHELRMQLLRRQATPAAVLDAPTGEED